MKYNIGILFMGVVAFVTLVGKMVQPTAAERALLFQGNDFGFEDISVPVESAVMDDSLLYVAVLPEVYL